MTFLQKMKRAEIKTGLSAFSNIRFFPCFLCFLLCARLSAQELPESISSIEFPSARSAGFGGYHAAYADDLNFFFSNPALLPGIETQFSAAAASFELIEFDMLNLLTGGQANALQNVVSEGIEIGMDLGGPFAISYIGENWGFGFFNVTRLHVIWQPNIVWKMQVALREELFALYSYAVRFVDSGLFTADAGITFKAFYRASYLPKMFLHEIKYIFESISNDTFESQLGVGVDIGLRFTLGGSLYAGIVFHDPYSPAYVAEYAKIEKYYKQQMLAGAFMTLPRRLSVGISWEITPKSIAHIIKLVIMADVNQLIPAFNVKQRDKYLEIALGAEIRLLEVLYFRAGFKELLPGAGLGVDFTVFKFDAAIYQKELGENPGDYSTWAANVSILYSY